MTCSIFSSNKQTKYEYPFFIHKIFDLDSEAIEGSLILSKSKTLLLCKDTDNAKPIEIQKEVQDVEVRGDTIYIIDKIGCVLKSEISDIIGDDNTEQKIWEEIPLKDSILKICANAQGVLMISSKHELIGFGNFACVLDSDGPIHVECFKNFKVLDVCSGDNFVVVLVQQKSVLNYSLKNEKSDTVKSKNEGFNLLRTQVWTFGSLNKGLLGTGDHVKRSESSIIVKLADIGVNKICCGSNHAAALTIDGRLFLWGFNNCGQISPDLLIQDQSTPTEYELEDNGKDVNNVLSVACGSQSTIIIFNDLSMKVLGKNQNFIKNFSFNMRSTTEPICTETDTNSPYIIGHGSKYAINKKNIPYFLLTFINDVQNSFMKNMINEHVKSVKPLRTHYPELLKIIESYEAILFLFVTSLKSARDGLVCENDDLIGETFVNTHFEEFIAEFNIYLEHLCDIKSFYNFEKYSKHVTESKLHIIFYRPFNSLKFCEKLFDLVYDLKLYNDTGDTSEIKCKTTERKNQIEAFLSFQKRKIKESELTNNFWNSPSNDSLSKTELHSEKRRFVLDSQDVPLKLHDRTNLFGSNRFLLFNDCLVYISNRMEICPINLVWISTHTTTNTGKYSFRIVTPENDFKVYTVQQHDRTVWMTKIRECISKAWHQLPVNPLQRFGTFTFSKSNHRYQNYRVKGNWFNAKFYGICHISSQKIRYKCRISEPGGELNGMGIIEAENMIYEGEFRDGKMDGYGMWRSGASSYEGYFVNDRFHGYGKFVNEHQEYQGEFSNGLRNGFGTEDDFDDGCKYIGLWQEGKKHGIGILIQIDGSYFEGVFSLGNLLGNGLGLFANGSYFVGEMSTVNAPYGNGTFYLPESDIVEEIVELDDINLNVKGSVLKGVLGGSWSNISIINGKLSLNEVFRKIPKRPESLRNHDTSRKWEMLMKNWKENIFKTSDLENIDLLERWKRLQRRITRNRTFQKDKLSHFDPNEEQEFSRLFELKSYMNSVNSFENLSMLSQSCSFNDVSSCSSKVNQIEKSEDNMSVGSFSLNFGSTSTLRKDCESQSLITMSENISDDLIQEFPAFIEQVKNDVDHPFHDLIKNIHKLFCASYGNWKCKPASIIAPMAMDDWRFIMKMVYQLFMLFFEKLPDINDEIDEETSSLSNSIYEIFMNDEVYSCLFLLYASKSSKQDELYNQRLIVCEKKSNEELRGLLKIEPNLVPILEHQKFQEAIQTMKLISQKNCPIQMLNIIQKVFEYIEECSRSLDQEGILSADNLLSISIYLIIKASVNHLGAELSLIEDLINNEDAYKLINFQQYIYTTMKIGYLHTISSRFFHN